MWCGVALFLGVSAALAQSPETVHACPVKQGTFQNREHIESLWAQQVLDEATAMKRLTKSDTQYNALQRALSRAYTVGEPQLAELCGRCAYDPVAQIERPFLEIKLDPEHHKEDFLRSIPKDKAHLGPLLVAQYPVFADPEGVAKAFAPDGPTFVYEESLIAMAKEGNESALYKLVGLARMTEGEFGEDLSDSIAGLWVERPQLVMEHWTELSNPPATIRNIALNFSPAQAKIILGFARQHCTVDLKICRNITRTVSKNASN
jgi:hypothetical protein